MNDGFERVTAWLAARGHANKPVALPVPARTAREAADGLGVQLGQIAKSVMFRRIADDVAVLVVTSGDQRVDERKVAAITGLLGRADAAFVKDRSGFSIGGVSPVAHRHRPVTLIDRTLFRFDVVWAAAGHPNGVFAAAPHQLVEMTEAPVADVVQAVTSPCTDVCKIDPHAGLCRGCYRTRDEIAAWPGLDDVARRALLVELDARRRGHPGFPPLPA